MATSPMIRATPALLDLLEASDPNLPIETPALIAKGQQRQADMARWAQAGPNRRQRRAAKRRRR